MIAALLLMAAAPGQSMNCDDALTQLQMNQCARADFEAADAALNAQWRLTTADMRDQDKDHNPGQDSYPGYFTTLQAAQRAWLTFRDRHCLVESFQARGGSMQPMLISGCMAELTRARTAQLKSLTETGH
jgi:uncharacterized protein YecT (DUF1311 family)